METIQSKKFHLDHTLEKLKHYLPAQFPLKDFVHHNTLHAFQDRPFFDALTEATQMLGVKSRLALYEFREKYHQGEIKPEILNKVISEYQQDAFESWKFKMLDQPYEECFQGRIGSLRRNWKALYNYSLDVVIHPLLFRILCNYLDQGIAIQAFPVVHDRFIENIRYLESQSYFGLVRTGRARRLLLDKTTTVSALLRILVADEDLYEQYLFDQQFSHPGWSGMVSVVEDHPGSLLDRRGISLEELIFLELILEIDAMDDKFGENWLPLGLRITQRPEPLFRSAQQTEYHEVLRLWQLALEESYFDQVAFALQQNARTGAYPEPDTTSFQAVFCIDDRSLSLRRYIGQVDNHAVTYGTPGFFGVEFYYQPVQGKFHMKVCPLPVEPSYLVKEISDSHRTADDLHFSHSTHGVFSGFLITHTIGFWSAIRLFFNIFFPGSSALSTSSFKHMDSRATLSVHREMELRTSDGLQVGFSEEEMSERVAGTLRSIGLIDHFSKIVYIVGHGASSVNNTHYAGYDCGACSGRPGSVNARVFCEMANHVTVRQLLCDRYGIMIPDDTVFIGALHDTTRDEIEFYEQPFADPAMQDIHERNKKVFLTALSKNARERARRLETTSSHGNVEDIHRRVKLRSVSLFEPRPELNHATNALCLIGRPGMTAGLFFDRRAFMNSYDCVLDPSGDILFKILQAVTPVCGGINLEYYFSRVDNYKMGAGSKLPHNVMGLIGVANGIDGDLRTGLPLQMIELHDPLRLMFVIEQSPDIVDQCIRRADALFEWFMNAWVLLMVLDPEDGVLYAFRDGVFTIYHPVTTKLDRKPADDPIFYTAKGNLPVFRIENELISC